VADQTHPQKRLERLEKDAFAWKVAVGVLAAAWLLSIAVVLAMMPKAEKRTAPEVAESPKLQAEIAALSEQLKALSHDGDARAQEIRTLRESLAALSQRGASAPPAAPVNAKSEADQAEDDFQKQLSKMPKFEADESRRIRAKIKASGFDSLPELDARFAQARPNLFRYEIEQRSVQIAEDSGFADIALTLKIPKGSKKYRELAIRFGRLPPDQMSGLQQIANRISARMELSEAMARDVSKYSEFFENVTPER